MKIFAYIIANGFLFLACSVLITLPLLVLIGIWRDSIDNTPKIKFEAFKKFYDINPDRWELESDNVICVTKKEYSEFWRHYVSNREKFHFGFFDFYKYKSWYKKLLKIRKEEKNMEITANMIKAVKSDIENMENLARRQQETAFRNIESILNNL